MLPTDKQARKERPMARGLLDYFPDALAEVANVSFVGNQQHNPGEEMHWAKDKSPDHADCIIRHVAERGTRDSDGLRHSAKVAWRALAMLQIELEAEREREGKRLDEDLVSFNGMPMMYVRRLDDVPNPYGPDTSASVAAQLERNKRPNPVFSGHTISEFAVPNVTRDEDPQATEPLTPTEARLVGLPGPTEKFPMSDAGDPFDWDFTYVDESPVDPVSQYHTILLNTVRAVGCSHLVAKQIVGGMTPPEAVVVTQGWTYIAGPMRGYPQYNFPAFDTARDLMGGYGYGVISPADIDRAAGIDEQIEGQTFNSPDQTREYVYRDIMSLLWLQGEGGDSITLLPGWETSTGATAEFFVSKWLGLKVRDGRTGELLRSADVDAHALVSAALKYLNAQ